VDFVRDVALLVTVGCGEGEIVIGGARYFVTDADSPARRADLAFTIAGDYKRIGMASSLMRHLVLIRRRNGLARLEAGALVLDLSVFGRSGLPLLCSGTKAMRCTWRSRCGRRRKDPAGRPPDRSLPATSMPVGASGLSPRDRQRSGGAGN